jgi:hypothetical protein
MVKTEHALLALLPLKGADYVIPVDLDLNKSGAAALRCR